MDIVKEISKFKKFKILVIDGTNIISGAVKPLFFLSWDLALYLRDLQTRKQRLKPLITYLKNSSKHFRCHRKPRKAISIPNL
jgi:hypothetical protein